MLVRVDTPPSSVKGRIRASFSAVMPARPYLRVRDDDDAAGAAHRQLRRIYYATLLIDRR